MASLSQLTRVKSKWHALQTKGTWLLHWNCGLCLPHLCTGSIKLWIQEYRKLKLIALFGSCDPILEVWSILIWVPLTLARHRQSDDNGRKVSGFQFPASQKLDRDWGMANAIHCRQHFRHWCHFSLQHHANCQSSSKFWVSSWFLKLLTVSVFQFPAYQKGGRDWGQAIHCHQNRYDCCCLFSLSHYFNCQLSSTSWVSSWF